MQRITYREALAWASSLLQTDTQQPPLNLKIAEWVQLHIVGVNRHEWLHRLDEVMPAEQWEIYQTWMNRILLREPYQYIIGTEDFYGRTFEVSPVVLIPRPETELLVEHVLRKAKHMQPGSRPCTLVDVGTGSGVIAVTLALEHPQAEVWALDISSEALQMAKQNASTLGANVHFLQGDLLEPLRQQKEMKIDILVSNPPYIPFEQRATVDRNVFEYEPHTALFAAEKGTYFYRQIIEQSRDLLAAQAFIAFEVGIDQAEQVVALLQETYPQALCEIKKDLQGIERIVLAEINTDHRNP